MVLKRQDIGPRSTGRTFADSPPPPPGTRSRIGVRVLTGADVRRVFGGERGIFGVPVGGSNRDPRPEMRPVPSVPAVRKPATANKAVKVHRKVAGAQPTPPQKVAVKPARDFMPAPAGPRVMIPATQPTEEKTMDLGQLGGKAIDAYLQYKLGSRAAPAPMIAPPQVQPVFWGGSEGDDNQDGWDIMADLAGLNKPKRRRRRRRLATLSDIRDLAALKSVLGNGEAFKTWIATHPS